MNEYGQVEYDNDLMIIVQYFPQYFNPLLPKKVSSNLQIFSPTQDFPAQNLSA